jgi:hypothetical protein
VGGWPQWQQSPCETGRQFTLWGRFLAEVLEAPQTENARWIEIKIVSNRGSLLIHWRMATTKKTKPEPKKTNAAFLKPVTPDDKLAAVVGAAPLPRTELTSKLWAYIKLHKLQDPAKKTMINADAKLKAVFDGKAQVTMFEMNKLVSGHVK